MQWPQWMEVYWVVHSCAVNVYGLRVSLLALSTVSYSLASLYPPPFERIPPALSARPDYLDIPAIFLTSLTYAFGINAHESGMARCGETVRR
jgi:hypothetical protein